MYDKRTPFQVIEKGLNFNYKPSKFEVWSGGKLIDSGQFSGLIKCEQKGLKSRNIVVSILKSVEEIEIDHILDFDLSYTSGDRIYLATVPKRSNISDYPSFQSFVSNVPLGFNIITRQEKEFRENEPYVCSIFTMNNNVVKVSFSFGINPRLLEFT